MTTTVAVASSNDLADVPACLDSIAAQDGAIELCWHDDASTDGTAELVADLLAQPAMLRRFTRCDLQGSARPRGRAHALDAAASRALGDMLCFLSARDRFAPGRVAAIAARPQVRFGYSGTVPDSSAGTAWCATVLGGLSLALLRAPPLGDANVFMDPRLFTRAGRFDGPGPFTAWRLLLRASLLVEPHLLETPSYIPGSAPAEGDRSARDAVLHDLFVALALRAPANPLFPCPRRNPASFWAQMEQAGCEAVAQRVFFPYARKSRLLGPSFVPSRRTV